MPPNNQIGNCRRLVIISFIKLYRVKTYTEHVQNKGRKQGMPILVKVVHNVI